MDLIEITLRDILTNESFVLHLSKKDAIRAQNDMEFANMLLDYSRKKQNNINVNTRGITTITLDTRAIASETTVTFPESVQESDEELIDDPQPTRESEQLISDTDDDLSTSNFRWSHDAILLLLEEYRNMEPKLSSGRITYKKAWEDIARTMLNKGHEVTSKQCSTRITTMKRTYKAIKDNNNKSGNSPRNWKYFEIMDSLLKEKPYMTPLATVSSTGNESINITKDSEPSSNSTLVSRKRKSDNIELLLKEIKANEAKKNKRHEERLDVHKKLINTLKDLIDKF